MVNQQLKSTTTTKSQLFQTQTTQLFIPYYISPTTYYIVLFLLPYPPEMLDFSWTKVFLHAHIFFSKKFWFLKLEPELGKKSAACVF